MTHNELKRLQNLVESVSCDQCHYYSGHKLMPGPCDGRSGHPTPCGDALQGLELALIDAE